MFYFPIICNARGLDLFSTFFFFFVEIGGVLQQQHKRLNELERCITIMKSMEKKREPKHHRMPNAEHISTFWIDSLHIFTNKLVSLVFESVVFGEYYN